MTRHTNGSAAIESPQVAALRDIVGRASAIHARAELIVHACADDHRDTNAWLARAGHDVVVTYRLCCQELGRLRLDADHAALREESVHLIHAHRHVVDEMLKARFGVAARSTTHDLQAAWDELRPSVARLRALAAQLGALPSAMPASGSAAGPVVPHGVRGGDSW